MNVTWPIHRHALRQPNKPALVMLQRTLSYRQLDQLIWRGAAHFRAEGLAAGDRVILMIADPLLHVLASLALARLGVGSWATAHRDSILMIDAIRQRIAARGLVCERESPDIPDCRRLVVDGAAFTARGTQLSALLAEAHDLIWRFFSSSGTTGKPKLFAISHALLAERTQRRHLAIPMASSDVCMSLPNLAFSSTASRNMELLTMGAAIVFPPARISEICGLTAKAGVNRLFLVPPMLRSLLDLPAAATAMRGMPVVEVGSTVVSMALRQQTVSTLTPGLHVSYGTNEAPSLAIASGRTLIATPDSVGYPVPNGDFEIMDQDTAVAEPGVVGHIRVRNDSIIPGYFDDPEADRRCFRDGWFYPGDLACWSGDGQVIFKGRGDDMMILNGINIYPVEIETCLLEHPHVIEAISFPLASDRTGDIPIAAVRLRAEVTPDALIGFAKERLGPRHPRKVLIVDDFPRTATGKPQKNEMARLARETAAD